MSTIYRHTDAAVLKADGNVIRGIASQERVDRDQDVILVDGIDTTDYERNPTFLGNHDRTFDLGTVTRLWRENHSGGRCLMFEARLLEPVSERQREVVAAIRAGARRGISIGFMPVEQDRQPVRDGQRGYTYRRVSLLEISSVSLPSCPSCLVEQKAWKSTRGDDAVLVLVDEPGCGCHGEEPRFTYEEVASAFAAAVRPHHRSVDPLHDPRARHHRSDLLEVDVDQVRTVIAEALASTVRGAVASGVRRAFGKVD